MYQHSSLIHHMRTYLTAFIILLSVSNLSAQKLSLTNGELPLSVRLGENFIRLHPDSIIYADESKSRKWNYEQGLMLQALHQIFKNYGDKRFYDYMKKNLDYYVEENGNIKTFKKDEYNLDNLPPGRMLLVLAKDTKEEKYKKAADLLRDQLNSHPRTAEGGFWHKKIYPNQMWLDGLFMAEPFYAKYSGYVHDTAAFDDVYKQFRLIYDSARDSSTGLLYHAWDAAKKQKWADPRTGKSPNFWGRAMGWYVMAIVDVLDYFPKNRAGRSELISILNNTCSAIMKVRDPESKLWFQVLDQGKRPGNYLEASASMMFMYAFTKGVNKGYLPKAYDTAAKESFESALSVLVTVENDGTINLNNVCKVSGLGGEPYRDGSFAYYVGEPKRTNDFKGYGPFLLAAGELEKAIKNESENPGSNKTVGLDYYFNNEWKDGKRWHYVWEDTTNSGFSELGKLFSGFGAKITSLEKAPTKESLQKCSIYIIVDPDTPQETKDLHYIDEASIKTITDWVTNGGVLGLFANDSGNCEFDHLNQLSEKFGIHFNMDSENRVTGKNFEMGKFDSLPAHPIFKGVNKIYLKEISTLKLFDYADGILKRGNQTIMAGTKYGKGYVFAVGDPWLYNEYIDNRKLPKDFENLKAARNLALWLLGLSSSSR